MNAKAFPILLTGLTLGTTWAIRGQFGHEQGAAWAGGVACILLVVFAKRKEWIPGGLKAALLGAIGWGMGGMMSYGQLVGYGRMDDFPNVAYALLMMFIVGGLYGLLGGGLFGLGLLESSSGKRIRWSQLLIEMTAGGLIFYYFVVEQLGILMTPPRSEAWAVCAGAAIALAYFCSRNGYRGPIRVALYSGLGAGFGFAFGEFLLVAGNVSGLQFNFWNVMEYSLGFFGGVGMAYGALGAEFDYEDYPSPAKPADIVWPVVGLMVLIPFIVWQQSFWEKNLVPIYEKVAPANPEYWAGVAVLAAFLVFLGLVAYGVFASHNWTRVRKLSHESILKQVGLVLFAAYLIYTFLMTGAYLSTYRPEQYLYLLNFGAILLLMRRCRPGVRLSREHPRRVLYLLLAALLAFVLLAILAISLHDGLPGAEGRFGQEV